MYRILFTEVVSAKDIEHRAEGLMVSRWSGGPELCGFDSRSPDYAGVGKYLVDPLE